MAPKTIKTTIKKILLINPFMLEADFYDRNVVMSGGQFAESPLGLGYIASYAKEKIKDLEIEIIDANLIAIKHIISKNQCDMQDCWDLLRKRVKEFSPDLVGISCLFHSVAHVAHQTAALVKELSPNTITAMGGSYPTISYEKCLKDQNIDYAMIGEGEVCFTDLILTLSGKKKRENLSGLAFKEGKNVIYRPNKFIVQNLDELPFPERENISPDDYMMPNKFSEYGNLSRNFLFRVLDRNKTKIGVVTASRGCPYSCAFCSAKNIWGKSIRYRSPKNVADEIEMLVKKYKVNAIVFNDDNFTVVNEKAEAILDEIIKRKLNIRWGAGGGLGVKSLTDQMIKKMYQSGIAFFNLAFESGSERTLKAINKVLDLKTSKIVIKRIRELGDAYIDGFFISGFHFETKKDIKETLRFAGTLDLDWALIRNYQAIPGSRIYDECLEKGYLPGEEVKYGSPILTSSVDWPNFSKEYILEENYLANLEINFLHSRNLKAGKTKQAIKDFKHIIELVPDHAMAYYVLGRAYEIEGDLSKTRIAWEKARGILKTGESFQRYFKHFNINLDKKLKLLEL